MAQTTSSGKKQRNGLNPWVGWGLSTLLLLFFNRGGDVDTDTSSQQPSKFTETSGSQIGNPIPVAMGRCLIKNPLISYYGDFRADIYTEEYGMHSDLDAAGIIWPLLLNILMIVLMPAEHPVVTSTGSGVAEDTENGQKNEMIVMAVLNALIALLLWLFNNHFGRTTIQKGFKYFLGWQNIICWTDENIGLKNIWMNVYDTEVEESTQQGVWNQNIAWEKDNMGGITAHIDDDQMFGGWDEGGGFIGQLRFYFGNNTQPKDPWMIRQMTISQNIPQNLKGLTPQYPMYMTCCVSASDCQSGAYIGKQATVPEMWFEVVNYPKALGNDIDFPAKIGEDANPAEVIYAILTNKDWGCNYNVSDNTVDLDSLKKLGKTLADEEMGISCLITDVQHANQYISKVLDHINGIKYDDPITGMLTFKLIRDDYDVDKLKVFDTTNCENMEFTRLDWTETTSGVTINFTLAEDRYENAELNLKDLANPIIKGSYTENSIDGIYFTTPQNAAKMARTKLLSAGYPLSVVNFTTNRYGFNATIGDPIVISWLPYGIEKQIYRITDLDYATLTQGAIKVTAIEDVFGFDKSEYEYGDIPIWTEPVTNPDEIENYLFFEVPYEMGLSLDTYLRAYAECPSTNTLYWAIWRFDNNTYQMRTESLRWSLVGQMSYGYSEGYPKDANGFELDPIGTGTRELLEDKVKKILADPTSYNADSGLNLMVSDGEIMSYDKITILPNGRFYISGIIRGVHDTIPKEHTIESKVWFLDVYQDVNGGARIASQGMFSDESLELTTRNLQVSHKFDQNKTVDFRTARRSEAPSIMANLQFGADRGVKTEYNYNYPSGTQFSHNIGFKFFGRNKFNDYTIKPQTDPTISVANSTQNVIKISCFDKEFEWKFDAVDSNTNVTKEVMEASWAEFCKEMTNINGTVSSVEKLAQLNYCTFEIMTYNKDKDLYSYDKYVKEILWVCPRLVGIVTNASLVQAYADTVIRETTVVLPASSVNPQLTYNFEDCCLIFVGDLATNNPVYTGQTWLGQDGQRYILSPVAYRIDGSNTTYNRWGIPQYTAITHQVNIDNEYIFRSNFNLVTGNYSDGIRYRNGNFLGYQFYSLP